MYVRFAPRAQVCNNFMEFKPIIKNSNEEKNSPYDLLKESIEMGNCSTRELEKAKDSVSLEQFSELALLLAREKESREQRLEEERHVDMLTGLRNDGLKELNELVEEINEFPNGSLKSILVVYLDLNKFKKINDQYGHAVGNQALIAFVDRLKLFVKRKDRIFRLHGDEFSVILPIDKDLSEQETIKIFQRLFNGVKKFNMPNNDIELSASVGYSLFKEGDTAKELLDRADKSMYKNKEESKGREL